MKLPSRWIFGSLLFAGLLVLSACGPSAAKTSIIFPGGNALAIDNGQSVTITAMVRNDPPPMGVTWTCSGACTAATNLSMVTSTSVVFTATMTGMAMVTATSAADISVSQSVTVTVTAPPSLTGATLAAATEGTAYSQTPAETGGAGTLTFSVSAGSLPAGLNLNGTTGAITGTPTGPASATAVTFSITVKDSGSPPISATAQFSITVSNYAAPKLSPASGALPGAAVGVGYSEMITVSNGHGPYMFNITNGSLPAGLMIGGSSGAITGTPTGPASATAVAFSVQVADSSNPAQTAINNYTITVGQAPTITSANNTSFIVGMAGSFTVTAIGTPAPTFSETGPLPSGVTLSAAGVLSGTPAAGTAGSYPITITASNGVGTNATQNFTLNVDQAPAITTAGNTTFTVGSAGSFTVMATGNPAPMFSETGPLPSGVTLSAAGVLSGTPAAGTGGAYPFTITASNGVGADATQNFTLAVDQGAAITSAANATFSVGSPGTFTVTATGNPAPMFSETGALPSGVTLSAAGVLSGTPAAGTAGSYPITITASNGAGTNATQNFTLNVDQGAAIFSPSGAAFTETLAGSFTVATTGFPAPSLSETGALPMGLTFTDNGNGTGTLAGTPAAGTSGTYSISFTASNGAGANATQPFSLGVNGNIGFLTNNTSASVRVIDLGGNAATANTVSLSAGATPQGIAVSPVDTLFAYVANGASKDVQVFCTRVEVPICPAQFGAPTIGGAVNAATPDHAHVADSTGTSPAPFTSATDVVIASTGLFGMVVDNGAGMAFKIDTNRTSPTFNQILGTGVSVPGALRADMRQAADFAYVADGGAEVVAINTNTGATTTISIPVAGATSYAVAASFDGNSVFVTDTGNGQVHVISSSSPPGSYVASTPAAGVDGGLLAGAQPHGIRFSPDGRFLYVADNANNMVAVIDPATLNTSTTPGTVAVTDNSISLTATLTGTGPEGIALTADGHKAFVADTSSNSATAIDTNFSDGTFLTALVTFGGAGNFSGAFGVATMPNALLHIPDPVPNAIINVPYTWILDGMGGTPPYIFGFAGGSFPPGLLISSNGFITGTPVQTGTFTFTIQVCDSEGQCGLSSFTIQVLGPSNLMPSPLPSGTVNVPYKATLKVPGQFDLPITFVTALGVCNTLSVGLDGTVSGTPITAEDCVVPATILYGPTVVAHQTVNLTINPDGTTTALAVSPAVPSSCSQPVTITATVMPKDAGPAVPTGSVLFSVDGAPVGPIMLSAAMASISVTLGPGTHTIDANYLGDANFLTSMTATTYGVPPCGTTPTVTGVATPNPVTYTKSVTITVQVSAPISGIPVAGTVTLYIPSPGANCMQNPVMGLQIGTAMVNINGSGSLMLPPPDLPAGTYNILLCYSGNLGNGGGTFSLTVNQLGTTTVLTTSPFQSTFVAGQPFFVSATVAGGDPPTGNVNFYDAASGATCASLGSSALLASNGVLNGSADVGPVALTTAGMHSILGCYLGDTNYSASSGSFTLTVTKANTTTTVMSSLNPSDFGVVPVTFTAIVSPVAPSTSVNLTGTVTFTIDGVPGSPLPVANPSFSTSSLAVGTHVVTAAYSGDSNTNGSDSTGSPLTETVNPALAIISRTPFGEVPDALLGFPYSQTIEVTGGSGGLTWSILSGDFTNNVGNAGTACQGFSLNGSTGVLSGTPTFLGTCATGGSGSFFVNVRDAAFGNASTFLSIAVRNRPAYVAGPGGMGPGGDDTVEAIDTGTKAFVSSIDTTVPGSIPAGIAVTRSGRFALVTLNFTSMFNTSQLLVIDTTTNTTLGPYPFTSCTGPKGVAIGTVPIATIAASPTGASRVSGEVTITTSGAHGLSVQEIVAISGVADSSFEGIFEIESVPSPTTFTYFQSAPDAASGTGGGTVSSERGYVACSNSQLAVIDASAASGVPIDVTPASLTSIGSSGATFDGVAISPDGSQVFATDSTNGQIVVVATATSAVVAGSPFTTCTNPNGIAITPAGDRAYVACDAQAIAVINTANDAVTTITAGATGTNWNDVGITPDGTRVYVTSANAGQFTVIDNTLATPAPIPAAPGSISIPLSALQGVTVPPLSPVPAAGLPVFIADSTATPTLTSSADIRDDTPKSFPADATASIGLTAGALNPVAGVPIGIALIPVPYLFIATQSLLPAPVSSTPYSSTPLAARGGVGALTWNATFTGAACGTLGINSSTGVISGSPGSTASGACAIGVTVTDAAEQTATLGLSFIL